MREILFRAWDSKGKFMLDGSYGNWVSFDGTPYEEANCKHNTPNIEIEPSEELILMQFTGLTDKNGVRIFEGDIVKYGNDLPSEVVFENQQFCATIRGSNIRTHLHVMGGVNKWAIIGNIHQNPELLK